MEILFISKMDSVSANILEHMQSKFSVQTCNFASNIVRKMIRIVNPDVIFVSHDDLFTAVHYHHLVEDAEGIPIVILCGKEDEIAQQYNRSSVKYMYKPLRIRQIIDGIREFVSQDKETAAESKNLGSGISESQNITKATVNTVEVIEDDGRKKILAVDDNAQVLRTIKGILKDEYAVTIVPSVMAAVEKLNGIDFDLILLDYEMPETDGFTALQLIKTNPRLIEIPVVFLTGVSDRERVMKLIPYKPEGYLLKPIDAEQLKETIKNLIE